MNPYLIIGLIIAWISSLAGVGYWQRQDGITTTEARYSKRDNADLIAANSKIKEMEEAYRSLEQQTAARHAEISATYQENLKNANQKTADLIAAARAGNYRLRDPNAKFCQPDRNNLPQTSASTGGCYGQTGSELSGAAAEFLLALTGEADNLARQLDACQAVVMADRAAE